MANDTQKQLNRIEKNQKRILAEIASINSLSEILLIKMTGDPDIMAKIKSQKGTGSKPVPIKRKRLTMEERKQNFRDMLTQQAKKHNK